MVAVGAEALIRVGPFPLKVEYYLMIFLDIAEHVA